MKAANKRKRSGNWVEEDKTLLKKLVKEQVGVTENKNTDTNTNQKKKKAWMEIETSFNNLCTGATRYVQQLKSQCTLMKIVAKKEVLAHRKEVLKTGGGPQPAVSVMSANDISVWLPNEFVIDTNEFDSDVVISQVSQVNDSQKLVEINIADVQVFEENEESTPQLKDLPRKKRKTDNTQGVATDKIKQIADMEAKYREELHHIQMENEFFAVDFSKRYLPLNTISGMTKG